MNGSIERNDGSIHVTKREDRSLLMHLLHVFLRPISNLIVKARKIYPPGSPRLSIPSYHIKGCTVTERSVDDIYIYDFAAKTSKGLKGVPSPKPSSSPRERIHLYYFAGGGWQSPPSSQHWHTLAFLAQRLPNYAISLVSYPLAPNSPSHISIPALSTLYRTLLSTATASNEAVILAGDSAGGNIVLALTLEALRQDESAGNGLQKSDISVEEWKAPHPVAILAISPSVDMARDHPAMPGIAKHDPILTIPFTLSTANAWTGDVWDKNDARVSPLHADVGLFSRANVRVYGVTGGFDILAPDALEFRAKLGKEGVTGEWLEWEKQMHVFPLAWKYGLKESREGLKWIVQLLKMESIGFQM